MKKLLSVVFWSVLAAAFIGPGTVTTAASAGAGFGVALLWALVFSTLACWVLQEAAARLTVVSGLNLGEALGRRYPMGWRRLMILALVAGAILLGCAAYEAGNILGGVAGARLAIDWPQPVLTLGSVVVAGLLLWFNSPARVAQVLSGAVAVMGIAFLLTAVPLLPTVGELLRGAFLPTLPDGSGVLALGLVGTTVVPYNLFLGSGIAAGQKLGELRFGIAVAVVLGGLISMAVLVVGTAIDGGFGFAALSSVIAERLGGWAASLFAVGLLSAGLSTAVTAPLAAAVTARSLFARPSEPGHWARRSWRYRGVWFGVLATGAAFGLSGVRPVPVIVLAQALNGIVLPLATAFLLVAVNDRRIVGRAGLNGTISNTLLSLVVGITLLLGLASVARAVAASLGLPAPGMSWIGALALTTGLLVAGPLVRAVSLGRCHDQASPTGRA